MSYEYAGTLFDSPTDAARAAIGDTSAAGLVEQMERDGWSVPYLDESSKDAHTLMAEVVAQIHAEATAD